jgi:pantoate--beta-alanine ligase
MKIITTIHEIKENISLHKKMNHIIAFVPTMGYLHEGHISLIRHAKDIADIVIVSIFVNPTQFAPNEDFTTYPRDIDRDCRLSEQAGCDYLFIPEATEIYPKGFDTEIKIGGVTKSFEGISRPTHFSGVATVVAKLLNIVQADKAIFGQKDYQQTLVIKKLVADLNMNTEIVVIPTMREPDGLAMSSRNIYLLPGIREKAGIIFKSLEATRSSIELGEKNRKIINATLHQNLRTVPEIKIDYACAVDADTLEETDQFQAGQRVVLLVAVFLGRTRLIDNAVITIPK